MTMKTMMQMLEDLTPLSRAVCSIGYDKAVEYMREVLPFELISIPQTTEHNGWAIPPSWDVAEAKILKDGRLIYDGAAHPLGVIALSAPFSGTVDLEELKKHLYYDHRNPESDSISLPATFPQLVARLGLRDTQTRLRHPYSGQL